MFYSDQIIVDDCVGEGGLLEVDKALVGFLEEGEGSACDEFDFEDDEGVENAEGEVEGEAQFEVVLMAEAHEVMV